MTTSLCTFQCLVHTMVAKSFSKPLLMLPTFFCHVSHAYPLLNLESHRPNQESGPSIYYTAVILTPLTSRKLHELATLWCQHQPSLPFPLAENKPFVLGAGFKWSSACEVLRSPLESLLARQKQSAGLWSVCTYRWQKWNLSATHLPLITDHKPTSHSTNQPTNCPTNKETDWSK